MKKRDKATIILLSVWIAMFCVSCSRNSVSPYTPQQIAGVILATQTDMPELYAIYPENESFTGYISDAYEISPSSVVDGAVFLAPGAQAGEIAVLSFTDEDAADSSKEILLRYIRRRVLVFSGYAPKQTALLEKGVVAVRGNTVALLICEQPQKAEAEFFACFSADPSGLPEIPVTLPFVVGPFHAGKSDDTDEQRTQPEPDSEGEYENGELPDDCDPAAILSAWGSGDPDALSDKNRQIYDRCADVIGFLIRPGMSDYEKELLIHDWIIQNTRYDEGALSGAPGAKPDPDSGNPYGPLINGTAVCRGYASVFQLFMDLLDIECVTVEGFSRDIYGKKEEHVWNKVLLDGSWYCVDVTWDDPLGYDDSHISHTYFNVSDEFLLQNHHLWDESAFPAAFAPNPDYRGSVDIPNEGRQTVNMVVEITFFP